MGCADSPVVPPGHPPGAGSPWGSGADPCGSLAPSRCSPTPTTPPAGPTRPAPPEAAPAEGEPELERLLQGGGEAEGLVRPLSPTRLQPLLPPEAQRVPEFQEVARVLAEMPRPLKRRGSMEQSPGPALPPGRTRQYQQLITRLLHRPTRRDEAPVAGDASAAPELPLAAPALPESRPPRHSSPPPSPGSPAPTPVSACGPWGALGCPASLGVPRVVRQQLVAPSISEVPRGARCLLKPPRVPGSALLSPRLPPEETR